MKLLLALFSICLFTQISFAQLEQDLPAVQVNGAKVQLAYNHPEITVLDFDFHPKGLLLLLRDRNSYHLRLTDELSQTIFNLPIPKKPHELFTDCFGNKHIIYADSVYQIAYLDQELVLYPPISIFLFNDKLAKYAIASEGDLYWQEFQDYNQSVAYLKQSKRSNQEPILLHETKDSILVNSVTEFNIKTAQIGASVKNPMGEINIAELQMGREFFDRTNFQENALNREIYCPLFLVEDSIYIFDHCGNQALVYNSFGDLQRSFPIVYHLPESWDKTLILDYDTHLLYGQFIMNGTIQLQQINRTNGKVEKKYRLEEQKFFEEIKIRDGWAYFLYNERQDMSLPNVYRQRLR